MSLWLFLSLHAAVDESQFTSSPNCACAVDRASCNQYCCCDPLCSETEKSLFDFCLPEGPENVQVSCDPKRYIRRINVDDIAKFELNGVPCYAVTLDPSTSEQIQSYDPVDLGLTGPDQLGDDPVILQMPSADAYTYQNGDFVLFPNDGERTAVWLPAALGGRECNVRVPIRIGHPFPAACRYPKSSDATELFDSLFQRDPDSPGAWQIQYYQTPNSGQAVPATPLPSTAGVCSDLAMIATSEPSIDLTLRLMVTGGSILPFQYAIECRDTPTTAKIPEHERELGVFVAFPDTEAVLRRGYVIGEPLRGVSAPPVVVAGSCLKIENDLTQVTWGGNVVKFGVNAVHVFPAEDGAADPVIAPLNFWVAPGDILVETQLACNDLITPTALPSENSGEVPTVRWTFGYQRFGRAGKFTFLLVSVHNQESFAQGGQPRVAEIVFAELNPDGSIVAPAAGETFKPRMGMFFDLFFARKSDCMKTLGIFSLVALLATIWAYYGFFFEDI
jgi:hypothetical protein